MPLSGVNVNNPQSQVSEPLSTPAIGPITFGGNVLGSGSTSAQGGAQTTGTAPDFNTILTYGVIALFFVFILQRIEN